MNTPAMRVCPILLLCTVMVGPVIAVTDLQRGAPAPPITLPDLDGIAVNTGDLKPKVVVLIFGELYHEKSLRACELAATALKDPRLAGQAIVPVLIVAQDAEPAQLKTQVKPGVTPAIILHDRQRQAYEAYRVAVLPSVVVVDGQGLVVRALAALTDRFADVLTDALLLATGQLDAEEFQRRLAGQGGVEPDADTVRAHRLTELARQLADRGLLPLAEEKYAEALKLLPDYPPANLGLGMLELRRRRLADAERHFRAVLRQEPASLQASLGLAFVQTQRGGEELGQAELIVRKVLATHPDQPRAHYLMGLIQEQRGDTGAALAGYKKAAQLLLEQEAQP